jgi:hypothetical protein
MESTEEYFSVLWLLSKMIWTLTPLLWAASRALAIGAEVKEYAWSRTEDLALSSSLTIAWVHPPLGEKWTAKVGHGVSFPGNGQGR